MPLCGNDVSTLRVAPTVNPAVDELPGLDAGIHSSRSEVIGTIHSHHR